MRRVVVTGMGLVSPLGVDVASAWYRLINGESGISRLDTAGNLQLPSRIAGQIPESALVDAVQCNDARFMRLAMVAASAAIEDAGWQPVDGEDLFATGVLIGSGCGGIEPMNAAASDMRIGYSDDFLRQSLIHEVSRAVAERYGFRGPRRSVSTACATGIHALGDAARMIGFGDCDVMIAGGTEAAICDLGMAGFCAAKALSTGYNDFPALASRPWDRDRDGFVMSEGAAILVLESLDHARARGARIYAEIAGYGLSGDAYHITAPSEGHPGAVRCMREALRHAGMAPEDIQYVNAHGTSTPLGDDLELEAVETVFGAAASRLAMSSTKSSTGHMLGAAGAAEAVFSILAIRDGIAPPTLNLENPSRHSVIDRVACVAQKRPIRAVLSNGFGFGGTNASMVIRAI